MGPRSLARLLALAAVALWCLPGCGLFRKPAGEGERHVREVRAGRARFGLIAAVDPGGQFVVIRTAHGPLVDDGSLLVCRRGAGPDSERSARVVISPERNRSHVTADVRDGTPRAGDSVFIIPTAESDVPAVAPVPTAE